MIHHGDCIEVMKTMASLSMDSIVTDPPYEWGFMGRAWDSTGIANNIDMWREALRVLKPGGHMLAFGGTRTYHRMVCAIEDAGFEIRDTTAWLYGSGFPKSRDIGKAIDSETGVVRKVIGVDTAKAGQQTPKANTQAYGNFAGNSGHITAPATEAAKQWEGWGTALKPAMELIVLARRPLAKGLTVAANVLEFGTGGLNIGACRIPSESPVQSAAGAPFGAGAYHIGEGRLYQDEGRWPANVILSDDEEVRAGFPESISRPVKPENIGKSGGGQKSGLFGNGSIVQSGYYDSETSAARFFYCAKSSKADRGEGNTHTTVKPLELMKYLCRLITPPGGTILDPFAGSGSTGKAAVIEGFDFIGIEREAEYVEIARRRIADEKDRIERAAAERLFA